MRTRDRRGEVFPLGAFIPSRFVAGQVVDVVLVQFTQFRADTGQCLESSRLGDRKTPIHLRAQATIRWKQQPKELEHP